MVDPGHRRKGRRYGRSADEALGMLGVGIEQDDTPLAADRLGASVVDVGRRVQANARVAVVVVVTS